MDDDDAIIKLIKDRTGVEYKPAVEVEDHEEHATAITKITNDLKELDVLIDARHKDIADLLRKMDDAEEKMLLEDDRSRT